MKKAHIFFKEYALMIASIIYFLSFCCELPTFIKSVFFAHHGETILSSFIICYIAILLVYRIFKSHTAVYAVTVSAVLTMANWSQIILYYSCNMQYTTILKRCAMFSVYATVSVFMIIIILTMLHKLRNKHWLLTSIFAFISIAFSLIIAISKNNSNTSNLSIGNVEIQPAIIMLYILLYGLSGYMSRVNTVIQRGIYFICFFGMTGLLVINHELGIPFFCIIAFIIMFFFLSSAFKPKTLVLPLGIMEIAGVIIMICKDDLRMDTFMKLTERSATNEHTAKAINNLKLSSWFGTPSYDIYLPEASSDFALNNNVHYWGYLWLVLFMLIFFVFFFTYWFEFTRSDGTSMINNLKKLSFTAFSVITIYNLLDNICNFPIIGVQLMWSGKSLSIACLSGLFLGTALFEEKKVMNLRILSDKLINVFIYDDDEASN